MEIIEKVKRLFFGKKEKLEYPSDFAIVSFTKIALKLGLKDNRTKVILRYFINNFGNYELKRYAYSEERVKLLKEIHKIPIFDKTNLNLRFPIYSRVMPGEAQYNLTR
jgi:hypothetical protein